jgi:hypothetical protein
MQGRTRIDLGEREPSGQQRRGADERGPRKDRRAALAPTINLPGRGETAGAKVSYEQRRVRQPPGDGHGNAAMNAKVVVSKVPELVAAPTVDRP